MVFIFPSGGPSAPGRRLSPQGRGGPSAALCYMARRDVGPRKELVPRPFTPHISASCVPQKGGLAGHLLADMVAHARESGRASGQATYTGLVSIGGSMIIKRQLGSVSSPGTWYKAGRGWRERVVDGTNLSR